MGWRRFERPANSTPRRGGFGDTLQFIRFAKLVCELRTRGRVFVHCMPELKRLLTGNCGIEQVFGDDETPFEFDVHCPLLSLPLRFDTTLETIPADVPYLQPDPAKAREWSERLGSVGGKKIGLVWAGSAKHLNDVNRSIPLKQLTPLAEVPNLRIISLQKHRLDRPESETPAGLEIENYSDELHDFSDTAALISQLDLVIGVDTAVVHLAGGLGKPTWVLLSEPAEWRWLLNRSDSPWYPTMRLFRQPRAGDWEAAIKAMINALREFD